MGLRDRRAHFHAIAGWPDVRLTEPTVGQAYVAITMAGRLQWDSEEMDGTQVKVESPRAWLGLFLEPEHARAFAESILREVPEERPQDLPARAARLLTP
jgi:hypothetical protein